MQTVAAPLLDRPAGGVLSTAAVDRDWLDRQLDVIVSAVRRQRPAVDPDLVDRTVGVLAAELAGRYPVDGYFPVLVHAGTLTLLPPG